MKRLTKDAKTFGIAVYGDGATVKRQPLVNVMASGAYDHTAVLDIYNCGPQSMRGQKKDGEFLAKITMQAMKPLEDKVPGCVDLSIWDGAASVQLGSNIMAAHYPTVTCIVAGEHNVSSFFSDIFNKLDPFIASSRIHREFHNLFGGGRHKPHHIFKQNSMDFNKAAPWGHKLQNQNSCVFPVD